MLYLILLLVVASLGLLIAALTTANTLWAWISVLISVIAAGLLVLDWIQNRRRRLREADSADRRPERPAVAEPEPVPVTPPPPPPPAAKQQAGAEFPDAFEESFKDFDAPKLGEPPFGSQPAGSATGSFEPVRTEQPGEPVTAVQPPVTDPPREPVTAVQEPAVPPDVEPGEESTDATDLLVVSELSDEVVVIDERPRYHLRSCAWLDNRPTLPLPVSEARELGFTPCALCTPDSILAARQRARS